MHIFDCEIFPRQIVLQSDPTIPYLLWLNDYDLALNPFPFDKWLNGSSLLHHMQSPPFPPPHSYIATRPCVFIYIYDHQITWCTNHNKPPFAAGRLRPNNMFFLSENYIHTNTEQIQPAVALLHHHKQTSRIKRPMHFDCDTKQINTSRSRIVNMLNWQSYIRESTAAVSLKHHSIVYIYVWHGASRCTHQAWR